MTTPQNHDTDVMIIGTGPTGGITALALATYGVRVHMVSMFNWLANSPRAHITNQRAMEVIRALGNEDDNKRPANPWVKSGDTLFTTSLAGEEIARMRTWGTGDLRKGDYIKGSPCPLVDIIQPEMEPLVVKHAAARGAQVTLNTEYLRHEQDDDGVTVYLKDRIRGEEYSLRAKYLVGADGANSRIAQEIGLNIEGQMARVGTVYVQFKGDLSRYMEHRPSILNWIVTPEASFGEIGMGLLRAVKPWTHWIAGWGFDIAKGTRTPPKQPSCPRFGPWWATTVLNRKSRRYPRGTLTRPTPQTTQKAGCSVAAMLYTAIHLPAVWAPTPAFRTASTWRGNWPSYSRATPSLNCWKPIPTSASRWASRLYCGPISPGWITSH